MVSVQERGGNCRQWSLPAPPGPPASTQNFAPATNPKILSQLLKRVRQPPESGCRKSSGQIESLLGHQTCRKRLIIPPMYIETCLQQLFFTQVHHTVSRNVLKVRGWLTHLLKFGEMVIWICFEAKSYFFPLENWHPALSSHLLKFGEIVFVPHLISYLHIVCTPNLLNPSVPMETIVSQVNIF